MVQVDNMNVKVNVNIKLLRCESQIFVVIDCNFIHSVEIADSCLNQWSGFSIQRSYL